MKGVFKEESGILSRSSATSAGGGSDFSAQNAPSFDIREGKRRLRQSEPPKGVALPTPSRSRSWKVKHESHRGSDSRAARSRAPTHPTPPTFSGGAQPPPAGALTPRAPSSAEPAPQLPPAPQRSPPAAAPERAPPGPRFLLPTAGPGRGRREEAPHPASPARPPRTDRPEKARPGGERSAELLGFLPPRRRRRRRSPRLLLSRVLPATGEARRRRAPSRPGVTLRLGPRPPRQAPPRPAPPKVV